MKKNGTSAQWRSWRRERFGTSTFRAAVNTIWRILFRKHPDFIPELDFVLEEDGKIIGNIMYTRCQLVDSDGNKKDVLTFGPLSIHPDSQRKGYGKKLQLYSFERAKELGYDTIVIFGNPENYVGTGFQNSRHFHYSRSFVVR